MRKRLISLAFLAGPLFAQHAVLNTFVSPNTKGITIGQYYCTIWMHDKAYQPYNFEVVCYGATYPMMLFDYLTYAPSVRASEQSFKFPGGQITWIAVVQSDGKIYLRFYGDGKDDVSSDPAVPPGIQITGIF